MYRITTICLLNLLLVSNGNAAEWALTATLNPSLEYDDNIFMREDKQGDYHASATPTLLVSRELENTALSLSAGYVLDRYETARQLNTDNPFWRFSSQYQTERSQWGLDLSYAESTSRNDAADDTGDFETNAIVTSQSVSPSYSFQLSERDSLSLNATYSKRDYSTADFSNNKTRSLSSSWKHQFTERFNGGVSVSASNTESTGLLLTTDDNTYNVSLTSNYELSEIWSMGGSIGLRQLQSEQTDLSGSTIKSKSNGQSLDLNVSYNGDIDSFKIGLSRSISPSSTGDVNEIDKFNISLSRQLSEALTASLSASYQVTTSASDESSDKRKNTHLSPSINWQFAPESSLSLSYNYRQQKESDLDTSATSHAIMLTVNYDWHGLRFSR